MNFGIVVLVHASLINLKLFPSNNLLEILILSLQEAPRFLGLYVYAKISQSILLVLSVMMTGVDRC